MRRGKKTWRLTETHFQKKRGIFGFGTGAKAWGQHIFSSVHFLSNALEHALEDQGSVLPMNQKKAPEPSYAPPPPSAPTQHVPLGTQCP